MDFSKVTAGMLPELFEQARGTPRKMLAFKSADYIKFEADLCTITSENHPDHYVLHIYVIADQFDDDIRCDHETGEDWVRKALEGSGLEFGDSDDNWDCWGFSQLRSKQFFGKGWGDESKFWVRALEDLKRAQATHACKCGDALTTKDLCPVCWVKLETEPPKKKKRVVA